MIKKYKLEGLDCANCAAKLENKIKKIEGVGNATLNFMLLKLTVEANEEETFEKVIKTVTSFSSGIKIKEI
ncbi:MAG: heavy metal-associated domain-containing protein [Bacilli bacterium]